VVVPVAFVGGMAVSVVEIVDVIIVRDRNVSAAFPVCVVVSGVLGVVSGGALVEVPFVDGVKVPVMDIVHMVAVRDGYVSTAITVYMRVFGVFEMGGTHECSSWACRIASLTM
jgi:hypothetical protein